MLRMIANKAINANEERLTQHYHMAQNSIRVLPKQKMFVIYNKNTLTKVDLMRADVEETITCFGGQDTCHILIIVTSCYLYKSIWFT